MKRCSTRRDFLKQAGLAGVGFWVAGGLTPADSKSPNEKLNIACIGVGGKGSSDTDQVAKVGNIVALCDIDDETLGKKAEKLKDKFPHAKKYKDFRKLFDDMHQSIDAVTVSTPDHTHAAVAMMAMKLGKHVYCQKPLTHTIAEARALREAALKYKVATQMGNQGSASDKLREAVEVIQSGAIGPVREVHVWTNRPIWPQAPTVTSRPMDTPEVPKNVHWDLWLGPAPVRPYAVYPPDKDGKKKGAYHPFAWRGWWDFGTGALGDMACHTCNLPYRALKLGYPVSVVAESGAINPETYPGWARIVFQFPARDDLPPVKFTWYEGHKDKERVLPPKALLDEAVKTMPLFPRRGRRGGSGDAQKQKEKQDQAKQKTPQGPQVPASGILMVGEKGTLFSPAENGDAYIIMPVKQFQGYKPPAAALPRHGKPDVRPNPDQWMKDEWVVACKGGLPAYSNFDYAALLTETILLGNVAMRVGGKKLEWDGPNMKFTNDSSANQFLQVDYRKGWSL